MATSQPAPERLVTVGAVRERTGLGERTIRRMLAEGRLKSYRLGSRSIRIDVADVDALIQPIEPAPPKAS